MSTQTTQGWQSTAYSGMRDDDWTSPAWGRPDTVAGGWGPPPVEPAVAPNPPSVPPPAPPKTSRGLAAALAVGLLALLLVGGAITRNILSDDTATAPPQTPATVPSAPVQPSAPSQALPTPSSPSQGQGQQGQQGQGQQGQSGALSQSQQAAVAAVSPGLVDVVSTLATGGAGAGTGIVLSSDGLVLTNNHVVAGASSIQVTDIGNGKTYPAEVVGYDRSHDVAVIRLTGASGLQTAPLGDSTTVQVGDAVVAVGNAGGVGGDPSAVAGKVTALDQSITAKDSANGTSEQLTGLIQFDAPIQPGDSGGALVDSNGKVVGVTTAGSFNGFQDTSAGAGYAVPMATAQSIAQQIIDGKSSSTVHIGETAFLGIGVGPAVSGGVQVSQVEPGTAAASAGLQAGDVITSIGGTRITDTESLANAMGTHHPGDSVTIGWTDASGAPHTAKVTLGKGPVG